MKGGQHMPRQQFIEDLVDELWRLEHTYSLSKLITKRDAFKIRQCERDYSFMRYHCCDLRVVEIPEKLVILLPIYLQGWHCKDSELFGTYSEEFREVLQKSQNPTGKIMADSMLTGYLNEMTIEQVLGLKKIE